MNLSMPQIKTLLSGMEEISKIQDKNVEKTKSENNTVNKNDSKKPQVTDMATFLSALGGSVKMTPKAKEKMLEIVGKKQKDV